MSFRGTFQAIPRTSLKPKDTVENCEKGPKNKQIEIVKRKNKYFKGKRKEYVLIVEDDFLLRKLIDSILKWKGFRVKTAQDGKEAIETFENFKDEILVVILDLTLPIYSGEEVFRRIKQINDRIQVIICTAKDEIPPLREEYPENIVGVLKKPFDFEDLFNIVKFAFKVMIRKKENG